MWNADFEMGTTGPDRPESESRPESERLPPKAKLAAMASILAVGVLRRRGRKGPSSSAIGRKEKNL